MQPLVIHGTSDALPKRGFVLRGRHPIQITVLDEIPPGSFAHMSVEELTLHVRGLIAEEIEAAEKARSAALAGVQPHGAD